LKLLIDDPRALERVFYRNAMWFLGRAVDS